MPEILVGFAPNGWKAVGEVKRFKPESLYEIINGAAELYLAYNVRDMIFISFEKDTDSAFFIDLSIYDMGSPANAFGVFSVGRSSGDPSLNFGREGYYQNGSYYIWKGRYYIQAVASDVTEELDRLGLELARKVTDSLTDSGEKVWGLSALPELNRTPGSVKYFMVDMMGLDFMRNSYTALYDEGGVQVKAYISRQDSIKSALTVIERYIKYSNKYGKGIEREKHSGLEFIISDMGDAFDVIFHKGRIVGGVMSVSERNLALSAAVNLSKGIQSE
ncbi:MAG: hypothetical protein JRI85_16705 [Deltaproteobacteria bacterium]|nr:hypothetical protein [Deltaproteobacteria bacterium]